MSAKTLQSSARWLGQILHLCDYHHRLIAQGKTKMTALIATVGKFLCILNAMVKQQQPWRESVINT